MGEAILSRASGHIVASGGGFDQYEFKTELITANQTWYAPKAKGQEFSVRLFGGGGGGGTTIYKESAGGGGYMNNGLFVINQYEAVAITIGIGGGTLSSGGSTSFGTLLSAAGGGGGQKNGVGGKWWLWWWRRIFWRNWISIWWWRICIRICWSNSSR